MKYETSMMFEIHRDKNGKFHKVGKPAVIHSDGTKVWYLHGEFHRVDGPAIEYHLGHTQWYTNGEELDKKEVILAKKILAGEMLKKLPLYVNHPRLKYIVAHLLQGTQ